MRIAVSFGDNEQKMKHHMYETCEEILHTAGAEVVPFDRETYDTPGSAIHEHGTCRMGSDPKLSVLNPFNQMHEVDNLFFFAAFTNASEMGISIPGESGARCSCHLSFSRKILQSGRPEYFFLVSFSQRDEVGHDQRFKELIRAFLGEFMEVFYPDVARRLDFGSCRFLDKELFTDIPEGSRREPDLVAEVRSREGEPALLLIHIEVQAEWGSDFPARMFQYYAMIWLRYRLPILPFVVYIRGGGGLTEGEYRVRLFRWEGLRFRYRCVRLSKLNAETYAACYSSASEQASMTRLASSC